MLMTKVIVTLPLFTMTPTIILSSLQWIVHLPMWLKRFICAFYYIPAATTPWVAIYTLKQFRKQFFVISSSASDTVRSSNRMPLLLVLLVVYSSAELIL
jgi:hypothetical protein